MPATGPSAVICSPHPDLVDLSRKVLKALNFTDISNVKDVEDCIAKLVANDELLLLLDWGMGEAACARILDSLQAQHPSCTRPIFMFDRQEEGDFQGLALEYGVMQIHTGPVSVAIFENRIKKLLSSQVYNHEIKEGLNLCATARKRGDIATIQRVLVELFTKYPKDEFLASELAEALFQADKLEQALKILTPFIRPDQKNPRILTIQGRCLMKKGQFQEASIYLQQADLVNPYNVTRLLSLGDAYLQIDQPQRAQDNFQKALKLSPQNKEAKKGLGQSLLLIGDINEALVYLRQVSDAAEMAAVFNVAAVIAIRNGRHDDGMKLYRVACRTVGAENQAVLAKLAFNMGLALYRHNDWLRSLYYFDISAQLNPGYEKAELGARAVESKVKPEERMPVTGDLLAALVAEDKAALEDLSGEEFEFRGKAADYDMDF